MTSAEYTAMHRSYEEAGALRDRLQCCRLTAQTREMIRKAYGLRRGSDYQGAVEIFQQVLNHGEAFAEGYDIPSIRPSDRQPPEGRMTELFAQPRPIEEIHYLDQEIVHCAGKTFRIKSHSVKTRKDDLMLCVSGDRIVYQASLLPEAEMGEIVEAPWNNLDWLKARKFSIYRPFLSLPSRWVSEENAYSHSL